MSKFKKKPIVIEAFQFTPEARMSNAGWPTWADEAWNKGRTEEGALYPTEPGTMAGTLSIMTLEGEHLVSFGDYIIRGVKGEIYPCKPDIFELTYEPAETQVEAIRHWNDIAASAYRAYAASTGNKNFRGEEMPSFGELPLKIRTAWQAAVRQAVEVSNGGSYGLDIEQRWNGWEMP